MLVVALMVVAGGVLAGLYLFRDRRDIDHYSKRLPTADAVLLKIDVAALRTAGILERLAGTATIEEPDYQIFVAETGFDYEKDLDLVYASWQSNSDDYYLLKGRFDWNRLRAYTRSQGGSCLNTFCTIRGSTPDRFISFLPLKQDVMAMAVSNAEQAAYLFIAEPEEPSGFDPPNAPVWFRVPSTRIYQAQRALPAALPLLQPLREARYIDLLLDGALSGVTLELWVECVTVGQAEVLSERLKGVMRGLAGLPGQDGGELLEILGAGTISKDDTRIEGKWSLPASLLERLLLDVP